MEQFPLCDGMRWMERGLMAGPVEEFQINHHSPSPPRKPDSRRREFVERYYS